MLKFNMHTIVHRGEHIAHCIYLAAAWIEGHGLYSHAAGFLLLIVLISLFVQDPQVAEDLSELEG